MEEEVWYVLRYGEDLRDATELEENYKRCHLVGFLVSPHWSV